MDGSKRSISPHSLCARVGFDAEPIVADVLRSADLAKVDKHVLPDAHCPPGQVERWPSDALSESSAVVYSGDQVSQGLAIALRAMEIEANFPESSTASPAINPIKKDDENA